MKKMDEMETKIALHSIKWAWSFTVIALFIWGIYDFIKIGAITPPFYLLIIQNIVYYFATQISKMKVGDESGKKAVIWYVPAVFICLVGFGALIFFAGR